MDRRMVPCVGKGTMEPEEDAEEETVAAEARSRNPVQNQSSPL